MRVPSQICRVLSDVPFDSQCLYSSRTWRLGHIGADLAALSTILSYRLDTSASTDPGFRIGSHWVMSSTTRVFRVSGVPVYLL